MLVKVAPLLSRVPDWKIFLAEAVSVKEKENIDKHGRTGRPLGNNAFFDRLHKILGKDVRPQKPGPKKKANS